MTDTDLSAVVAELQLDQAADDEPAVEYGLLQVGRAIFGGTGEGLCWFCTEPIHDVPPQGSSCPVRRVPVAALTPARRRYRSALS